MSKKLLNRVLVSIIFAPTVLLFFYLGGLPLQIFLGILNFAMLYELRKIFNEKGLSIPITQLFMGVLVYTAIVLGNNLYLLAAIFISVIVLSAPTIFGNKIDGAIKRIATGIFSMIYISLFLSMLIRLSLHQYGREILIALIVTIWVTDTFAYFTGMLLGKHRGILPVSPNKSVEGFIGGMLFSILGSWLCVHFLKLPSDFIWMIAISAGIIGQYGDLFESLIKRDLQIKDSSRILGEHGGILDRFDSLLLSAPALYIIITFAGV